MSTTLDDLQRSLAEADTAVSGRIDRDAARIAELEGILKSIGEAVGIQDSVGRLDKCVHHKIGRLYDAIRDAAEHARDIRFELAALTPDPGNGESASAWEAICPKNSADRECLAKAWRATVAVAEALKIA